MKRFYPIAIACLLCSSVLGMAQEPKVLNKEALPAIQPVVVAQPVAVPETIGVTLLAGVGFFMLFSRRRYT